MRRSPPLLTHIAETCLRFFTNGLLEATKAMAPTDRYSLADVEALMAHARSAVLDHIKLLRLVFTTRQEVRARTY